MTLRVWNWQSNMGLVVEGCCLFQQFISFAAQPINIYGHGDILWKSWNKTNFAYLGWFYARGIWHAVQQVLLQYFVSQLVIYWNQKNTEVTMIIWDVACPNSSDVQPISIYGDIWGSETEGVTVTLTASWPLDTEHHMLYHFIQPRRLVIGVGENFFLNGGIFYDDVLKKLPSPRDRLAPGCSYGLSEAIICLTGSL